jgi:hypothetical protein
MKLDWNVVKAQAAAIQSIVLAIGVIIGGFWTLATFSLLGQKGKADLEIATLEQQRAKLEVNALQRGVVNIDVEAKQISLPDQGLFISVVARLSNGGIQNTFLDFRKHKAFSVARIRFDGPEIGTAQRLFEAGVDAGTVTLRKNHRQEYPLVFKVSEPGLYQITFRVPLSDEERESDSGGYPRSVPLFWVGSTDVVVQGK